MAREMKYHSPNTDLTALQRELAATQKSPDDFEPYDELEEADDEDPDDQDEPGPGWSPSRRN
jgi:hypothetical protein